MEIETSNEIICEHCGTHYSYDDQRRCWKCDVPGCPECLPGHPGPLCEECCGDSFPEDISQGRPSFARLQRRMHLSPEKAQRLHRTVPVYYYLFDVLVYNGHDVRKCPYEERRDILTNLNLGHSFCRIPPSYVGQGVAMLETARSHGLEGVVAKRLGTSYEAGRRSQNWRKIKIVKQQEFVIGGWTPQENADNRVGSLLLGYYSHDMRLIYAGSVGSGFSDRDHEHLGGLLRSLERKTFAFAENPAKIHARPVAPRLMAEVQYRRWPEDGFIQQAAYKGLRTDKPTTEVQREDLTNISTK